MTSDNQFKVVLYQPEIPANTGNIGRLCVGTNSELHLIKPMRFIINDKQLKRAGLDYWDKLKLIIHDSFEDFCEYSKSDRVFYFTTKAEKFYFETKYLQGDYLLFGPETRGIPESILFNPDNKDCIIKIPMSDQIRSINLANSVGIALYEALRQNSFTQLI